MGTNEQVMAWFMDTYSMYRAGTVTEIVTGKPVSSGGHARPARGHRSRRRASRQAGDETNCRSTLNGGTGASVQGFGNVGSYCRAGPARFGLKVGRGQRSNRRALRQGRPRHSGLMQQPPAWQLAGYSNALAVDPRPTILTMPCDVLVPAAMERVIDADIRGQSEMPGAGGRRQWTDHAGCRSGAAKAQRRVPDT
jgi:glutamate dehydrogenase (NAD(P)+)